MGTMRYCVMLLAVLVGHQVDCAQRNAVELRSSLAGVDQHTKDNDSCAVCIAVVRNVLDSVSEAKEKAEAKEVAEKKAAHAKESKASGKASDPKAAQEAAQAAANKKATAQPMR